MALYFSKRRHWPPSRPVQFILAFLALILAVVVLVAWLVIGYHRNVPATIPEQEPSSTSQPEIVADIARCLVILDTGDDCRFLLVQSDPTKPQIVVMNIPNTLESKDSTLRTILKKRGSPQVVQAVATALDLPLTHYVTLNSSGIANFVNQFESGITYTLPEEITYTDENGTTARLTAKEHTLTGSQVNGILEYNNWKKKANKNTVATDLLSALINQYVTDGFPLRSYFGLLSNDAVTDLRIDNFNAYQSALQHIAQNNTGTVCRVITLPGSSQNGEFVPDLQALQQSELHH